MSSGDNTFNKLVYKREREVMIPRREHISSRRLEHVQMMVEED